MLKRSVCRGQDQLYVSVAVLLYVCGYYTNQRLPNSRLPGTLSFPARENRTMTGRSVNI